MSDCATRSLPERCTSLIEGLMNDVEADVCWGLVPIWLIKLFWRRLRHLKARLVCMLARFNAGTLPAPGAARREPAADPGFAEAERVQLRAGRSPAEDGSSPSHGSLALELPQYSGWVVLTISGTIVRRFELEEILEDPEAEAMVAATPQYGRVLRPLCRMLGAQVPAWLRLPRRARRRVVKTVPPAPEWMVAQPGAELRADGTVWMRFGASTAWRPGGPETLEEVQKFDRPRKIWPREE